jgi:hypothetical protein
MDGRIIPEEDWSIILPHIILPFKNSLHAQAFAEGRQKDVRAKIRK